jgi:hypothetical protein
MRVNERGRIRMKAVKANEIYFKLQHYLVLRLLSGAACGFGQLGPD